VERREAQRRRLGSRQLGAGRRAPPEQVSQTCSGPACGGASQASPEGVSQTPGASRRSIPCKGRKKGAGRPGPFKQQGRARMAASDLSGSFERLTHRFHFNIR